MATAEVLRLERTFDAPVATVFDAWSDEAVLRRWFHAVQGWETSEASVDLRVGGGVRVVMHDPHKDEDHGGGGRYTEVDRPNRLAFTWTWDGEDRETLIEIEFEPAGEATTVRFTHSNLLDHERVLDHEKGWIGCFENLERALAADAAR